MNEHLLHYLVEEVLLLWVRSGGHHLLEVVDECGNSLAVKCGQFELLDSHVLSIKGHSYRLRERTLATTQAPALAPA